MTNWKEQLHHNFFSKEQIVIRNPELYYAFIETQIIEKLIEDAEQGYCSSTKIAEVTKQLRDKWL